MVDAIQSLGKFLEFCYTTMACESHSLSDSEESVTSDISEHQKRFIRSRLVDSLLKSDDFTVQVVHTKGEPPHMSLNFGRTIPGTEISLNRPTKVFVTNIPEKFDEEYLKMFFEYDRGQGSGPVKTVSYDQSENAAIIEFVNASSVSEVLKKQPIKIMGTEVDIVEYDPYLSLGQNEPITSIKVEGVMESMIKNLKMLKKRENDELKQQREIISNLKGELKDKDEQLNKQLDEIKRRNDYISRLKDELEFMANQNKWHAQDYDCYKRYKR